MIVLSEGGSVGRRLSSGLDLSYGSGAFARMMCVLDGERLG